MGTSSFRYRQSVPSKCAKRVRTFDWKARRRPQAPPFLAHLSCASEVSRPAGPGVPDDPADRVVASVAENARAIAAGRRAASCRMPLATMGRARFVVALLVAILLAPVVAVAIVAAWRRVVALVVVARRVVAPFAAPAIVIHAIARHFVGVAVGLAAIVAPIAVIVVVVIHRAATQAGEKQKKRDSQECAPHGSLLRPRCRPAGRPATPRGAHTT